MLNLGRRVIHICDGIRVSTFSEFYLFLAFLHYLYSNSEHENVLKKEVGSGKDHAPEFEPATRLSALTIFRECIIFV